MGGRRGIFKARAGGRTRERRLVSPVKRRGWNRIAAFAGVGFGLFVLAAVIGFQDNLFRYAMDPRAPFQTTPAPPAPDYAKSDAWLARPNLAEGELRGAAIFFIHPTTFWGGSGWNAPIDARGPARRAGEAALPTYAGAFAPLGAIWAPRYRQAALYASLTHRFDARRARALAYEDVRRAFTQFLSEAPPDAPILLVGVEQGGLHALGLLQDVMVTEPYRERLAAAYIIDQATPLDLFAGPLSHFPPCSEAGQSGCVISWTAVRAEDAREIRRFRRRSMVWTEDGRLEATEGRALLCVNPLLGAAGEDFVPRRNHRGGVNAAGLALGVDPAPLPAQTSAQCRDGVLLVDRPTSPGLRKPWSWGRRFKPATAFLFYADVRRDAAARLGRFDLADVRSLDELPPLDAVVIKPSPIHKVPDLR